MSERVREKKRGGGSKPSLGPPCRFASPADRFYGRGAYTGDGEIGGKLGRVGQGEKHTDESNGTGVLETLQTT